MIKKKDLSLGMTIEKVTFSLKTDRAYAACQKYFAEVLINKGTSGKGLMSYNGFYSINKEIFIGMNLKIETRILSFNGEAGNKALDSFRSDFLLKEQKTNPETQIIIYEWLETFMVKHKEDVPNFSVWNKNIINLLNSVEK